MRLPRRRHRLGGRRAAPDRLGPARQRRHRRRRRRTWPPTSRAMMDAAMGKETGDVALRLWTPQGAEVAFVKQVAPAIEDLTARADAVEPAQRRLPDRRVGRRVARLPRLRSTCRPHPVGGEMLAGPRQPRRRRRGGQPGADPRRVDRRSRAVDPHQPRGRPLHRPGRAGGGDPGRPGRAQGRRRGERDVPARARRAARRRERQHDEARAARGDRRRRGRRDGDDPPQARRRRRRRDDRSTPGRPRRCA